MFILKSTQQRCNPYAPYTDQAGTQYPRMPAELYEEIPEPEAPAEYLEDPAFWFRTEQLDAPYVIYTRRADEQIAEIRMQRAKVLRAQAVQDIIVTTQAGNSFDGNEDAQNRMSRAISGLDDDTETVPWVLANNTIAQVTKAELQEALRLSGAAMAELWVKPYA